MGRPRCSPNGRKPIRGRALGYRSARCNDATLLLRYFAVSLAPVSTIGQAVFDELGGAHPRIDSVVAGVGDAMRSVNEPIVVVIDDLHLLTDEPGMKALGELTAHLGPGSQIALVGQHEAAFPLGKARATGDVFEIGTEDLRFDVHDAAELLRRAGAGNLTADEVIALTQQTEGWGVGLYLAALSRRSDPATESAVRTFGGADRFVADYLREEVLSRLPSDDVDFLIHTSVLDEMSGTLCDATLETTGSGATLERLERSNLLVVPLDHRREKYRYHHLFRDLLLMELEHRTPELVPVLTGRASAWFEEHDLPDLAIAYSMAGGHAERVAMLVASYAQRAYYGGRAESLRRWISWLDEHVSIDDYPAVAIVGSLLMALTGRSHEAERWAWAADRVEKSDDPHFQALRAYLSAMLCRQGVTQMRIDAEHALALLPPSSEWRPAVALFHALALMLSGEEEAANEELHEAGTLASALHISPAACAIFTEIAVLALRRGDIDAARSWIARALELIDEGRLYGYASSALTYAVASRLALSHGDLAGARRRLDEASSLRTMLTSAIPTVALQARIELACCALALGDSDAAEVFLDEGAELLRQRPGLGTLADRLVEVRERSDRRDAGVGGPPLTRAEARLLPLLTTHLTFREIAEQLYVSPHTVKTQAISIYRKLGASSRSAAIDAARAAGLLPSR